jgi:hypothetical protein
MVASNAADFGARNAKIVELAIVERSQFTNGLLISGPLLEGLADVRLKSPVVYEKRYNPSANR